MEKQELQEPVPSKLPLPKPGDALHPSAIALIDTLTVTKPGIDKLITKSATTLPDISISQGIIDTVGRVLHVIVTSLESRGIPFRKARSQYETAYFEKGHDRLYLTIEEITSPRECTPEEKRKVQWQSQPAPLELSGRLKITVAPERYGRTKKTTWIQDAKTPLQEFLPRIVQGICTHYSDLARARADEEERQRKSHEAYLIQQQEERKRQHQANLQATAHTRAEDLLKAAEWSRIHHVTIQFIADCEHRWRNSQSGEITAEQQSWLSWARETANLMSPAELGYPDPSRDGAFDPAAVPIGGPYPPKRDFPRPPTMPKIPTGTAIRLLLRPSA